MVDQNHLVNIARAIEKGTRVATLDELKAKGQSSFKVINAAKIMELIKEAVDMAVDSMAGQKLSGEKEKLQALAKKEFDDLLKRYQDTQKTKGEIEGQAAKMQAEIDEVQRLLAGGGGDAAKMGLAGISGQIAQMVQKLQAAEKGRIDIALEKKKADEQLEALKAKYASLEQEKAAAVETGQGVAKAVDSAYSKIDAGLGQKAREMGLNLGPEPRTPEEKMERLAQIANAAVGEIEKERRELAEVRRQLADLVVKHQVSEKELAQAKADLAQTKQDLASAQSKGKQLEAELSTTSGNKSSVERELTQAKQDLAQTKQGKQQVEQTLAQTQSAKQQVEQTLAQTQAKKAASEKELGELQDFKKKLEEKVDEQGSQYAEVHQMMARIGQRADDLIKEVESGRLKHLKPEEKKIIVDAMTSLKDDLKKLQDERAFLEKKLFYMSMTIDSLEAELLAAKGLTPSVGGSAHLKDDGLQIVFDEAGVAAL